MITATVAARQIRYKATSRSDVTRLLAVFIEDRASIVLRIGHWHYKIIRQNRNIVIQLSPTV